MEKDQEKRVGKETKCLYYHQSYQKIQLLRIKELEKYREEVEKYAKSLDKQAKAQKDKAAELKKREDKSELDQARLERWKTGLDEQHEAVEAEKKA